MFLADSSVWIDHLRRADPRFIDRLVRRQIVMHPFVVGEVLLGSIANRRKVARDLDTLIMVTSASAAEVRRLMDAEKIYGHGVGWVDVNLLASALITPDVRLLTRDKRLHALAVELGVA